MYEMWNTICCEEGTVEISGQRRVGLTLSTFCAPRLVLGLFLTTILNEKAGAREVK